MSCNNGRIYQACGPTYEQSCGGAVENTTVTCNEGCFCPSGTVQHNGNCIRVEECPCTLRGKQFKAGSGIKKDCNTCKCKKGVWKCSDETCSARCGAIGDPHYQTFDGKRFDFMGRCSYYLLKRDNDLEITAENVACPGKFLNPSIYIYISSLFSQLVVFISFLRKLQNHRKYIGINEFRSDWRRYAIMYKIRYDKSKAW